MPITKLMTVAVPTRISVQKIELLISELTGVGKSVTDRPKRAVGQAVEVLPVLGDTLPEPRPSSLVRVAASVRGVGPACCILAIAPGPGSPV